MKLTPKDSMSSTRATLLPYIECFSAHFARRNMTFEEVELMADIMSAIYANDLELAREWLSQAPYVTTKAAGTSSIRSSSGSLDLDNTKVRLARKSR